MKIFHKLTLILPVLSLALGPSIAHAGGWEYYEDGYGGSYYSESYNDGYRADGDAGAALALGLVGGMALGALASPPASSRYETVGPACYRAWRRVWNDYRELYERQRVRVCE